MHNVFWYNEKSPCVPRAMKPGWQFRREGYRGRRFTFHASLGQSWIPSIQMILPRECYTPGREGIGYRPERTRSLWSTLVWTSSMAFHEPHSLGGGSWWGAREESVGTKIDFFFWSLKFWEQFILYTLNSRALWVVQLLIRPCQGEMTED